jgi:hypothetical protein
MDDKQRVKDEERKALVTLAEWSMRREMGDEAFDQLYDEDGNRRRRSPWRGIKPTPERASPESTR